MHSSKLCITGYAGVVLMRLPWERESIQTRQVSPKQLELEAESVRMGVKDVSARWLKANKALKKETRSTGKGLQRWPESVF
jgi:hypothetical protein